eukprot:gene12172-14379_t
MFRSACDVPTRIWIVDNSSSMNESDGNRIIENKGKMVSIKSTRWEELRDSVNYHAQLASELNSRCCFRLLNPVGGGPMAGHQYFSVGSAGATDVDSGGSSKVILAKEIMSSSASGCTPLSAQIRGVHALISQFASELYSTGKKIGIVIATDGLPSDNRGRTTDADINEFKACLQTLQELPVWVVVRLCTDEEKVVDFWGEIDKELELPLEVLDDLKGEALEVKAVNPWLTYGQPLQRAREFCVQDKLFDLLDERPFTLGERRSFAQLLLGCELPEPELDWSEFERQLKTALAHTQPIWDPITGSFKPWLDASKMRPDGVRPCCNIV